jgi:hypothetical protein
VRTSLLRRAVIAGIVFGVHLLGLLALLGSVPPAAHDEPEPQFISFWPERPQEPAPLPQPEQRIAIQQATRSPTPEAAPPNELLPDQSESATTSDVDAPAPAALDWRREAVTAARNVVEQRRPRDTFSEPLPEPRKPCKIEQWQWSPEEKKAGLAPLPYVVVGRCVVGLGFFGCGFGEPPEIDTSALTAALVDGSEASVPDANTCE